MLLAKSSVYWRDLTTAPVRKAGVVVNSKRAGHTIQKRELFAFMSSSCSECSCYLYCKDREQLWLRTNHWFHDVSWNPKHIILAWYKEDCLIHSDFHIITFWVCCFFYKPQCNPRFHVCFDMGNSFTFHFWLSKCWVKVSFVLLPLWLKQCLWDHLGVEQLSWKTVIIGAWLALNWIDSRLVTAWLYGLWGNN